jgi:protein-S-isoprenylcysteine O-methyltransferase Ste14
MVLEVPDDLTLRQAAVLASALVYWTGVFVQARRVRKLIGRSANLKPRTSREKLLWIGWFLVIAAWLGQPILIACGPGAPRLRPLTPALLNSSSLALGIALIVLGYTGTLWCYSIMGNAWRIGIDQNEKTSLVTEGPFRIVRHPIYLFQIVILLGVLLLLPTALSLLILIIHFVCVSVKALDEESHLLRIHGEQYRNYLSRTGRLFPRLF